MNLMNKYTLTRMKEWTAQLEHLIPTGILPSSELVKAIRRDHDDLRVLLEILKSDKAIATRRNAFKKFTALLTAHARSEEMAVYAATAKLKAMRKKTLEGYAEHDAAEMLVAKINGIRNPEKWTAAVQVLAEMVEHHIDEEERDLLPMLDKLFTSDHKFSVEAQFLQLRAVKKGAPLGVQAEIMH